jgi:two-component sensor histidine kinase
LVQEAWTGASLASLAAEMAGPHGGGERIAVSGPEVHLAPQTATAMALGLHELATNAAKYGALSAPEGRVSLSWTVDGEARARRLRLTWRETGGPPAGSPGPPGFGSRLIERGLASEMKADVRLAFEPGGVVFSLTAPLSESITEG